ncbi:VPEID-CTERM sorting domain-containing protein [Roseovarius sp. SYSU LYC5161]|jgi:2-methylcitrate dehydratase PrpD|uniref:VPEID-CTERM sorting domain-containing protein n=1 Tax=Roseovarius halophilus (ex Wu et al. 2025) TaxID=3376060 RepID=UPI002871C2CA|nr:VPEID-CTERM sorting domain-containing protein [Roseovarius sp.]
MRKLFATSVASAAAYTASAASVSAQSITDFYCRFYGWYCQRDNTETAVPEIDASSGLMAMGAVLGMLLLAWEIKRRRA